MRLIVLLASAALAFVCVLRGLSADAIATAESPRATVDGTAHGWTMLGESDFANVNCADDTWKWKDGTLYCTGKPIGVLRSAKPYTNFELMLRWRHMKKAGNSGVFVWAPEDKLKALKPNQLPQGIEIQILDHGYREQ